MFIKGTQVWQLSRLLTWYQKLLLTGRMTPYSGLVQRTVWLFAVVTLFTGFALLPPVWATVVLLPVVGMLFYVVFGPAFRHDYATRLRAKGKVLLPDDVAYRMLRPLIEGYGRLPEVQDVVLLFASNLRVGQEMFGERWYLSAQRNHQLLFLALTDVVSDTPLQAVADKYDCVEALRASIRATVHEQRHRYIAELAARAERHDEVIAQARAARSRAENVLADAINARIPDDLELSMQLSMAHVDLTA